MSSNRDTNQKPHGSRLPGARDALGKTKTIKDLMKTTGNIPTQRRNPFWAVRKCHTGASTLISDPPNVCPSLAPNP